MCVDFHLNADFANVHSSQAPPQDQILSLLGMKPASMSTAPAQDQIMSLLGMKPASVSTAPAQSPPASNEGPQQLMQLLATMGGAPSPSGDVTRSDVGAANELNQRLSSLSNGQQNQQTSGQISGQAGGTASGLYQLLSTLATGTQNQQSEALAAAAAESAAAFGTPPLKQSSTSPEQPNDVGTQTTGPKLTKEQKMLEEFFPQFKSLFPASSPPQAGSSGATNTSSTSSNSTSGQSIIDGLLFGGSKDSISGQPSAGVSASSTASSVAKTGAAGISTSSGMSTPSMDNLFSLFTGSSSSSSPSTSSGNGAITPKVLGNYVMLKHSNVYWGYIDICIIPGWFLFCFVFIRFCII